MDLISFLNSCRLCYSSNLSEDDSIEINEDIENLILYVSGIEMISSDNLPTKICKLCNLKLKEYNQFKNDIIMRQEQLVANINQIQNLSFDQDENSQYDKINDEILLEFFQCSNCDKNFSLQQEMEDHFKSVHKVIQCKECSFQCRSKSESIKHMKEFHKKPRGKLKKDERACPDCGKILKGNNHLNFHIKTKHLKLTKYSCDLCEYKSYGKYEIRSHIEIHHLPLKLRKEFPCDLCASILTTAMSLKIHKIHKHSGLRQHQCNFCGKAYSLKETLKSHIKHVHEGKRNYHCPNCEKQFNSRSRLNDHFNNYHGDKQQFPCDECDKVLNSQRNLKTHQIYHKPPSLSCHSCDKKFFIKKNLIEHQDSVHNGIKYQCGQCDRLFQSTSGLRRHLKSH